MTFKLLKVPEVAEILSISPRQAYYLVEKGEIACVVVGEKLVRVEEQDLNDYIERKRKSDYLFL